MSGFQKKVHRLASEFLAEHFISAFRHLSRTIDFIQQRVEDRPQAQKTGKFSNLINKISGLMVTVIETKRLKIPKRSVCYHSRQRD